MFPKGTIYEVRQAKKRGEYVLALPWYKRLSFHFIRGIGAGLLAVAVIGFWFTYGPVIIEELRFSLGKEEGVEAHSRFGDLLIKAEADRTIDIQNEARNYGVESHYSLVIPKIEASANVIANVDPGNKDEYMVALEEGVAHAKGTYFPGQGKSIYLFSHSTDSPLNISRYNAVFYLLRKLEKDDEIWVFFADKKYRYKVSKVFTTSANDVSWLTEERDSETLLLQTCDPPGTTWKRLIVEAKPIGA